MLKNLSVLEHVIEGKAYTLFCDPNSPLNHVKDALVKFLGYVQQVEDQVKAAQEAKEAQAKQAEVALVEEASKEEAKIENAQV